MAKIYDITLTIRDTNNPFVVESSDGVAGQDIIEVVTKFPFCVVKALKRLHDAEIERLKEQIADNDVPF